AQDYVVLGIGRRGLDVRPPDLQRDAAPLRAKLGERKTGRIEIGERDIEAPHQKTSRRLASSSARSAENRFWLNGLVVVQGRLLVSRTRFLMCHWLSSNRDDEAEKVALRITLPSFGLSTLVHS